jgi:ABC-type Fe3+/spermidine/putrescine transport system ATPase subunit
VTAIGIADGSVRQPPLRPATPGAGLKPGDDALLAIRPTGVLLLRTADETPHLTGTVADVAFRGRGYEYAIDLPGLGRLTGVFARHRTERGDAVGLRLDPEGCHLFGADAGAVPAAGAAPNPALTV